MIHENSNSLLDKLDRLINERDEEMQQLAQKSTPKADDTERLVAIENKIQEVRKKMILQMN